jgi:hypothetical protein
MTAVMECLECNVRYCGEHLVCHLRSGSVGYCENCSERAIALLKQANISILELVHEWESIYGYQDKFEIDIESDDIAELDTKLQTLKQRWNQLSGISTTEDRKKYYKL